MTRLTDRTSQLVIQQALRFDGYAWAKAHGADDGGVQGFLTKRLYEPYQRTWRVPADSASAMALNFWLHRIFYGWGSLPQPGSAEWMQMVFLYLHTYRLPAPKAFGHASPTEWDSRPKGSAEQVASEIRLVLARAPG